MWWLVGKYEYMLICEATRHFLNFGDNIHVSFILKSLLKATWTFNFCSILNVFFNQNDLERDCKLSSLDCFVCRFRDTVWTFRQPPGSFKWMSIITLGAPIVKWYLLCFVFRLIQLSAIHEFDSRNEDKYRTLIHLQCWTSVRGGIRLWVLVI